MLCGSGYRRRPRRPGGGGRRRGRRPSQEPGAPRGVVDHRPRPEPDPDPHGAAHRHRAQSLLQAGGPPLHSGPRRPARLLKKFVYLFKMKAII